MSSKFVVCDIETTGLGEEKEIIEIALLTVEDGQIKESYETLINPLRPVPDFILNLTSIQKNDLQNAPKFYEVSEAILERLEGHIFVSHNVDFDLGILQKKFFEMGIELKLKTYCTLRNAQELIPELKSYSLDALCSFFRIKNLRRHRAYSDAIAAFHLFKELLVLDKNKFVIKKSSKIEKKFKDLPHLPGIWTLRDSLGKVILNSASKSILDDAKKYWDNLNKYDQEKLASIKIEYNLTGTYLIALLLKKRKWFYSPKWVIRTENIKGFDQFVIAKYNHSHSFLWSFLDLREAKRKYQKLQNSISRTQYAFQDSSQDKNEILKHNMQIQNLSKEVFFPFDDLILFGPGRKLYEISFVLIRNQKIKGWGFSEKDPEQIISNPEQFLNFKVKSYLYLNSLALRYIKELKNDRYKTEFWKEIPSLNKKSRSSYESVSL